MSLRFPLNQTLFQARNEVQLRALRGGSQHLAPVKPQGKRASNSLLSEEESDDEILDLQEEDRVDEEKSLNKNSQKKSFNSFLNHKEEEPLDYFEPISSNPTSFAGTEGLLTHYHPIESLIPLSRDYTPSSQKEKEYKNLSKQEPLAQAEPATEKAEELEDAFEAEEAFFHEMPEEGRLEEGEFQEAPFLDSSAAEEEALEIVPNWEIIKKAARDIEHPKREFHLSHSLSESSEEALDKLEEDALQLSSRFDKLISDNSTPKVTEEDSQKSRNKKQMEENTIEEIFLRQENLAKMIETLSKHMQEHGIFLQNAAKNLSAPF